MEFLFLFRNRKLFISIKNYSDSKNKMYKLSRELNRINRNEKVSDKVSSLC